MSIREAEMEARRRLRSTQDRKTAGDRCAFGLLLVGPLWAPKWTYQAAKETRTTEIKRNDSGIAATRDEISDH